MKEDIIKKLNKIKDIFAFLIALEFIIMFMISSYSLEFKDVLVMLLPLGISSLVWNKSLYMSLMDNRDALYAKSQMSYGTFILIGFFLALMSAIAFATSIWRWW